MTAARLRGLPPILAPGARWLILGSMPGAESLAQQQYYAHPRNLFWPFMEALYGVPRTLPYAARCAALAARGVAVWDVLAGCERRGSLDSAIIRASEVANAIPELLAAHPGIGMIGLNGGKAQTAFRQHLAPRLPKPPPLLALPSTSPANAGRTRAQKLAAWRGLLANA